MVFPRPVEAVVFDMDGLLIDTEALIFDAISAVSTALGAPVPLETFRGMVGLTRAHSDPILHAHFGDGFQLDVFSAQVDALFALHGDAIPLKPGVVDLLDHLDAIDLPFGLCTSSRRPTVDRHLGAHGLLHRFRHHVTGDAVTHGKPHPEPYQTAARYLGLPPGACLAREDSHNGVRSASRAEMMTVMVPDMLEPTAEMNDLCVAIAADLHEVRRWLGG